MHPSRRLAGGSLLCPLFCIWFCLKCTATFCPWPRTECGTVHCLCMSQPALLCNLAWQLHRGVDSVLFCLILSYLMTLLAVMMSHVVFSNVHLFAAVLLLALLPTSIIA